MLHLHPTGYRYDGAASPSTPGGMAIIYKDLIASGERTRQVIADVAAALAQGRNCLVLTNWTGHLQTIAGALRDLGHDPVTLKGGMGAKDRAAALARLTPQPGRPAQDRGHSSHGGPSVLMLTDAHRGRQATPAHDAIRHC